MAWDRRTIITMFGAAAGLAGAAGAARTLGSQSDHTGTPTRPKPASGVGRGKSVAIIGAGIAGLTTAFNLQKSGFDCTIYEADTRAGGRNRSLRTGDTVSHRDGAQSVSFGNGDYFNAGPARLPGFHTNILSYCRELGVALEPFIYENLNGFFMSDAVYDGKPLRHRSVRYSIQSALDEFVTKSFSPSQLAQPITAEEFDRLEAFILSFCGREGTRFTEDFRRSFLVHPGAADTAPVMEDALSITELSKSAAFGIALSSYDFVEWQAALMQPVGGMDKIVEGFLAALEVAPRLAMEVVSVALADDQVTLAVRDRASGQTSSVTADYCVCTAPLPIVDRFETNFEAPYAAAIRQAVASWYPSTKIAWSADRRFWEEDDGIYGGASSLDFDVMQFWYPSNGFNGNGGVLLGAYTAGEAADRFGALPLKAQISSSKDIGMRLHTAFSAEAHSPICIDWADQAFAKGGWGVLTDEFAPTGAYARLCAPQGRFRLAGDYLTHLTGWQEGAVLSAHRAIEGILADVEVG
ncbi:MAG: flavin monoamine oxidase family protein [Sphingomonadales bacterium]